MLCPPRRFLYGLWIHQRTPHPERDGTRGNLSIEQFPNEVTRRELREEWVKAIARANWVPTKSSAVCSQHFRSEDMDYTGQTRRLRDGAVPSVFPTYPKHLQITKSKDKQLQIANNVPIPGASRSTSDAQSAAAKSSVKFGDKRGTTAPQNFPDKDSDDSIGHLDMSDAFFPSACTSNIHERLLMEPSVFEMLLVDENILSLPVTWGRNIPIFGPRVIMYTQLITIEEESHIRPVFYKELCVLESGCVTCSMIGCRLKKELFWLPEGPLESCKQLENILMRLDALEVCEGISEMEAVKCDQQMCFLDCLGKWRHKKCLLVPNANGICAVCYTVISSWQRKQLSY